MIRKREEGTMLELKEKGIYKINYKNIYYTVLVEKYIGTTPLNRRLEIKRFSK